MSKLYKTIYYLLIALVIVIVLLLISSVLPIPGKIQVKIVQSGSMEPAIKTGGIVVIKPFDSYKVGDIITFGPDTKKVSPTTHRITDVKVVEGQMVFKTKGDANDSPDVSEISESAVIGKVLFSLPYLGYVVDFVKKPLGFGLIIGIPALLVIYEEVGKIAREVKKIRSKKTDEEIEKTEE